MQQIHQRKAGVEGFDVFYREAGPAHAPAQPLLPGLPISGHMFRDLVPQLVDRFHAAAPVLPRFGHSSVHDRSNFGHSINKLAQEIGRVTEVFGQGRFATAIRAITARDASIESRTAWHRYTPARASVAERRASQSAIALPNARRRNDLPECQVFELETIGIFTWDLDDRITSANQAFLRISGHDRESLVSNGMTWTELTPLEWRDADAESLVSLSRIGIALPYEKEFFRKDGTRVPVLVTNTNIHRDAGQRLAFVVDLSDRKQAEEAARDSEQRCQEAMTELARVNRVAITGQLSASIVHEVSQPIAGAVTNAQVALRRLSAEPLNVDEVRLALNRMVRDGNRAADVIHRIRALINKAAPRRENLEINQAILDVVALTRGEVVKNGVSLRTQLAENLPSIQADRVQLQQVVLNLVVNAVEAMSSSGDELRDLRISTARVGSDAVLITVQDSGPGVDPADRARVFDTFYSTKSKGLGMGLSICRAIVEGHGGKLWVSTCVPRGAIFQFTLPVCAYGA